MMDISAFNREENRNEQRLAISRTPIQRRFPYGYQILRHSKYTHYDRAILSFSLSPSLWETVQRNLHEKSSTGISLGTREHSRKITIRHWFACEKKTHDFAIYKTSFYIYARNSIRNENPGGYSKEIDRSADYDANGESDILMKRIRYDDP